MFRSEAILDFRFWILDCWLLMVDCSQCDGTGYRSVEVIRPDGGRTSYAVACDHGRGASAPAGGVSRIDSFSHLVIGSFEINGPELVEAALARRAGDLTPEQIQIARLIGRRVGQAAAIRIADLIKGLGGGYTDRDVKAMLKQLRRILKIPIAATKAPPYGIFIPGTAQEMDDAHDRYMREGIESIITSQLFREDLDLVQRLRGQLGLAANSKL